MRIRHTMGNDYGGRRSMNPENCPKITKKDVLNIAESMGVKVYRESGNFSMWWIELDERKLTIGMTNYIAFESLMQIKEEGVQNYFDRIYAMFTK